MSFGRDFCFEEGMSDAVEGGASLAWRLLATLEGGTLVLATSALLAYTVRSKILAQKRNRRIIRNVLVTNTTNLLGRELKQRLEAHGCVVHTVQATSGAGSGAGSGAISGESKVDAIIVVGAEPKSDGLNGMADMVTEDVYNNLKLLETLSSRVQPGGYIAWARTGGVNGAFTDAGSAFDNVLRTSLQHIAKVCSCEAIWIDRCDGAERMAAQIVTSLFTCSTQQDSRFSVRNAAHRAGAYVCRWLKIIS